MKKIQKMILIYFTYDTLSNEACPKTKFERDRLEMIPYTMNIKSIIYVIQCIRPNVSYALSITSKYQSNLGENH
jgi:hypothetical protein